MLAGLAAAERVGDPLALVAFWKHWSEASDVRLADAVQAARATGCTWEQIAGSLGVTKQSAWVMFRGLDRAPGSGQGPATSE